MTKHDLMSIIKEIDNPSYRECLNCGCVYKEPGMFSHDHCPECQNQEYVNISFDPFIPAMQAIS